MRESDEVNKYYEERGSRGSEEILFWVSLGLIALIVIMAALTFVDRFCIDLPTWLWPN